MMQRTMAISAGLAAALLAVALTSLSPTDVSACGVSKRILTPAEQARREEEFEVHRKATQARNIREIAKVLAKTKISAPDRTKVEELRDEAAKLRDVGKLSDADRALFAAWKMLGHPELFVSVHRPRC